MNKIIAVTASVIMFTPVIAGADYYRPTGGGFYELYVDDCSDAGMRRALDNAVASRHAVITKVKCVMENRRVERRRVARSDEFMGWDLDSLPIVDICPCVVMGTCGC